PYLSAIQMKAPEIIDFRGFFVARCFFRNRFPATLQAITQSSRTFLVRPDFTSAAVYSFSP
ncbi:MAG: hypothetical protein ACN6P5_20405, partial [Pseudomonas protegens]